MAVYVYKDGKEEIINPSKLQAMLRAGWSVDKNEKKEQDLEEEIRAAAKEAGIKSYHNKNLDKLIAELEALNEDED